MTEPSNGQGLYRVVYSEWVRNELKALIDRAKARGLGPQLLEALKQLDSRLHKDPQSGDPLRDLLLKPAQLRIITIPPLVARYVLDEDRRLVIVAVPIRTLPRSGF